MPLFLCSICYKKQLFIFISMISKKWLGATITIKHKSVKQTVTIVDDPQMYKTYRALGLDYIFKSEPKKMTFPKTKRRKRTKKSDSNLSNTSEHSSTNIDREGDDK